MAEILTMLALSPTMEEGNLVAWTKKEGDAVEEGEVIAEVETDKATMEMESFFSGTVLKILVEAGNAVPVGAPMAIIGDEGEDIAPLLEELSSGEVAGETPPPREQAEPAGQGEWEEEEDGEDGQPHKVDREAAPRKAEASRPGQGQPSPRERGDKAAEGGAGGAAEGRRDGRLVASPVARRMAREHDLDLARIDGSGPQGRIVKKDVEAALEAGPAAPARPEAPAARPEAAPTAPTAEGQPVKLTQMRKAIARRMSESWQTPHFALTTSVTMDALMAWRSQLNSQLKAAETGVKLSVNDFIIKACALALHEVPEMNVAWAGDHIVQFDAVHIGVAVAIEGGLITPVVRDADKKTLGAISRDVRDLATRARDKKLAPEEFTGSTFTVSNLGMFGVTNFMAVLNLPEAGILAIGAVVEKPVVRDGVLAIGKEMEVTLSCDHRSTDGAVGARFLQAVKRMLENPAVLTV